MGPAGRRSPRCRPQSPRRPAGAFEEAEEARVRCRDRRQRAPAAPRPLDRPRGGATRSREILAPSAPAASMADLLPLQKRGPFRSTWTRVRKARPQLILSRRPRRRLRILRWCGRRRLRRRLLQAQAVGADWREGGCLVSRAAPTPRPKTAAPRLPLSPPPSPTSDEDPAQTCSAILPIPPLRPAGPGRALLLLPAEQVSRAESPGAEREGGDAVPGVSGPEKTVSTPRVLRPRVERFLPAMVPSRG